MQTIHAIASFKFLTVRLILKWILLKLVNHFLRTVRGLSQLATSALDLATSDTIPPLSSTRKVLFAFKIVWKDNIVTVPEEIIRKITH